jgi:hypothetical protein
MADEHTYLLFDMRPSQSKEEKVTKIAGFTGFHRRANGIGLGIAATNREGEK